MFGRGWPGMVFGREDVGGTIALDSVEETRKEWLNIGAFL